MGTKIPVVKERGKTSPGVALSCAHKKDCKKNVKQDDLFVLTIAVRSSFVDGFDCSHFRVMVFLPAAMWGDDAV